MNKNIFLVLAIIFMVIVVTGTGGWLTSSAWADGIESDLSFRTAKRRIDGRIYCIESVSEEAAGTIYTQYTYSTIRRGNLITVNCVIRYPQCMNYSEPQSRQTLIYHLIERFEGKFKRFFKLRPKGRPKKKFIK